MECKVKENRIKVYDSYLVRKADFEKELADIKNRYTGHCVWNRSIQSLKREWAAHNLLYSLNIRREKTKDVDFDYPQGFFHRFAYFILGSFALLVIK